MRNFAIALALVAACYGLLVPGSVSAAAPGCYELPSVYGEKGPGTWRHQVEWPSGWPRSTARPNGTLASHNIWLLENAASGGTFRMVSGAATVAYYTSASTTSEQQVAVSGTMVAPGPSTHLAVLSSAAAFVVEFCPAPGSPLAPTPTPTMTPSATHTPVASATPTIAPSATQTPVASVTPTLAPSATATTGAQWGEPCGSLAGTLRENAYPPYYVADIEHNFNGSAVRVSAPGGWLNLYSKEVGSAAGQYVTVGTAVNTIYPIEFDSVFISVEAEQPFTLDVWDCSVLPTPTPSATVTPAPAATADGDLLLAVSALATQTAIDSGRAYTATVGMASFQYYTGFGLVWLVALSVVNVIGWAVFFVTQGRR